MYGRVFAATQAAGQSRRARLADLLIASTAAANGLPLYTRNPSDFGALRGILTVVKIYFASAMPPFICCRRRASKSAAMVPPSRLRLNRRAHDSQSQPM